MSDALALRTTVREMIGVYEHEVERIREAFATLADAERNLSSTIALGAEEIHLRDPYNHRWSFDWNPSRTLDLLKRDVWRQIVKRLEVRQMLSMARARELEERLDKGELPEITEHEVFAFAQFYAEHLDDMLGEAISEVFNMLRPRSNEYKTNSQLEIGRRVILNYTVERSWNGTYRVRHGRTSSELTALENVFTALDGKGSINKHYRSALEQAINATPTGAGKGQTAYFAFKCYGKGTLHLEFLRPDLLDRLNKIAGGRRLRPRPPEEVDHADGP